MNYRSQRSITFGKTLLDELDRLVLNFAGRSYESSWIVRHDQLD